MDSETKKRLRKRIFTVLKLAVFLLVVWGIWHTVVKSRADFAREHFSLSQVRPGPLVLAAVLYLLGMLPMGLFWFGVLRAMGQRPRFFSTLRAYYIGHLGKYVPGKGLVVVLRTGLIRGARVDTTVAALSVFVETLTMMAVGAFLGGLFVALTLGSHWPMLLLALVLMIGTGLPTVPPLFRRIVRLLKMSKMNPQLDEALAGLSWRLMAAGWLLNILGWLLLGSSLWLTIRAIPLLEPLHEPLHGIQDWALITASAALAMVAGFVSLIPGGAGVREYVLTVLMIPRVGRPTALISAVLLRIVWLAAEVLTASVLYWVFPAQDRAGDLPVDSPQEVKE